MVKVTSNPLAAVIAAQTYLTDRVQQDLTTNLDATVVVLEFVDSNLDALELVTMRQGIWTPPLIRLTMTGGRPGGVGHMGPCLSIPSGKRPHISLPRTG